MGAFSHKKKFACLIGEAVYGRRGLEPKLTRKRQAEITRKNVMIPFHLFQMFQGGVSITVGNDLTTMIFKKIVRRASQEKRSTEQD